MNQTRYGVSNVYLECKTERIFAIASLGKKLVFNTSGPGVVQLEPNLVSSIPWVTRL